MKSEKARYEISLNSSYLKLRFPIYISMIKIVPAIDMKATKPTAKVKPEISLSEYLVIPSYASTNFIVPG